MSGMGEQSAKSFTTFKAWPVHVSLDISNFSAVKRYFSSFSPLELLKIREKLAIAISVGFAGTFNSEF